MYTYDPRLTGNRSCEYTFGLLAHKHDLISQLKLDVVKLSSFVQQVQFSYLDNPYHNLNHGADVLQAVYNPNNPDPDNPT